MGRQLLWKGIISIAMSKDSDHFSPLFSSSTAAIESGSTVLQYYTTTVLHYYTTTLLHYYSTTVLQYYSTTVLQYYSTRLDVFDWAVAHVSGCSALRLTTCTRTSMLPRGCPSSSYAPWEDTKMPSWAASFSKTVSTYPFINYCYCCCLLPTDTHLILLIYDNSVQLWKSPASSGSF